MQLKNMISVLFQSRAGGTHDFVKSVSGSHFGWKAIQDLYKRELDRTKSGLVKRVPKLKESDVCCDSWTRLNVLPLGINARYCKTDKFYSFSH